MEKSIIKIVNMSFKYKKEDYLFRNFNLEIKEGSFTTIIGKNGSGKSTLAKILIGLYKAEGYIAIDGYLLNEQFIKKIRRIFSVCFANSETHFIGETVRDDLVFSLENLGYFYDEMTTLIDIISKKFKLENILDKEPSLLTESEKTKVAIASSLIHSPKILLLDETINKLTDTDKKLVFKLLKEYQKEEKLTIILITHNLEETLFSDRIIVLENGKIIKDETKEEIYKNDYVKGFTKNPSLMKQGGVTDYKEFAKKVLAEITDCSVSFEVFADDFETMEKEADVLANLAPNVYVKIPITNTKGESSIPLIKKLAAKGYHLNVTAIFTLKQVQEVVDTLNPEVNSIVSVFAGRIADTGVDAVELMKKAAEICKQNPNAELLWASCREFYNIMEAEECGCQIITVQNSILAKSKNYGKDLEEYSLETVRGFFKDASGLGFSIL